MSDLLRIAAMQHAISLCGLEQVPIRHGGFKPDPAPKWPTKKRAKVKAARKQRRKANE